MPDQMREQQVARLHGRHFNHERCTLNNQSARQMKSISHNNNRRPFRANTNRSIIKSPISSSHISPTKSRCNQVTKKPAAKMPAPRVAIVILALQLTLVIVSLPQLVTCEAPNLAGSDPTTTKTEASSTFEFTPASEAPLTTIPTAAVAATASPQATSGALDSNAASKDPATSKPEETSTIGALSASSDLSTSSSEPESQTTGSSYTATSTSTSVSAGKTTGDLEAAAANFYYGLGGSAAPPARDDEEPASSGKDPEVNDAVDGGGQDLNFGLMNAPHDRIQAVQNLLLSSQLGRPQLDHQQPPRQPNRNHPSRNSLNSPDLSSSSRPTTESPNPNQNQMLNCMHKGRQFVHGQQVPIDEQPCLSCTCRRAVLQCYLRVCPPVISLDSQRRMQQIAAIESGGVPQRCRTIKEPSQCCPSLRCEPAINGTTPASDVILATAGQESVSRLQPREPPSEWMPSRPAPTPTQRPTNQPQRDSILLISSNHHKELPVGGNASTALATATDPQSGGQDHAHALMEALLETVYASAAGQANGLQLQGSCLINGSLYVEGSAVIPEGNALCQYCYCIRQRVMCVRPKCQLMISGCTPRYSSKFACCPTSYSCNGANGQSPARLAGAAGPQPASTQVLSAKLWAALDSLGIKVQAGGARLANSQEPHGLADEATTSSAPPPSTTINEPLSVRSGDGVAIRGEESSLAKERDDDEDEDEDAEALERKAAAVLREEDRALERAMDSIRDRHLSERQASEQQPTLNTTPIASSEADFFEPMAKLGPLVMSPAAPSSCIENNRHYAIGEQIPTLESCKHCYCGLDGLKECKMIECRLKVAHDCRPVVPEGHCCPVRYECPSDQTLAPPTRSVNSRQRSEDLEAFTTPFMGAQQCKSDTGDGCPDATASSQETTSPQTERDGQQTSTMGPSVTSSEPSQQAMAAVNEELNKFVMRINQQNSSTDGSPSDQNPDVGGAVTPSTSVDYSLVSAQPLAFSTNASDYHSVHPQTESSRGVPSVQVEPVDEPPLSPGSAVEFSSELSTLQPSGQRDSRSTNSQILGEFGGESNGQTFAELNAPVPAEEPRLADQTLTDGFMTTAEPTGLPQARANGSSSVQFDDEIRGGRPAPSNPTTDAPLEPTAAPQLQPTTGTPIGLETERTPEANGWLRSLSGIVQSFGRRLSGQRHAAGELRPAASDMSANESVVAANQPTARSVDAQGSLVDHLLRNFMSGTSAGHATHPDEQQQARPLVMRPLGSAYTLNDDLSDSTLVASGSSSGEPVEIVTAAAAADIEPEPLVEMAPRPTDQLLMAEDSPTSQFSKRSGLVEEEPLGGVASTLAGQVPSPSPPQAALRQRQLTCFDPPTNRTYQPNERIPKDDPCKTCTCMLGEELCQTLVCPERPAESCHEERRPGECCANYICSAQQPASRAPSPQSAPNRNGQATQRAMNVDSDKPTGPMNGPSMQNATPIPQSLYPQRLMGPFQAGDQRRASLPQTPIRTSDLTNLLPPHLRFRPSISVQPLVGRSPLMADQHPLDRNRVLFGLRGQAGDQLARGQPMGSWPQLNGRHQSPDAQFGSYVPSVRFGSQQNPHNQNQNQNLNQLSRPMSLPMVPMMSGSLDSLQWPRSGSQPEVSSSPRILFSNNQMAASAFRPMTPPTDLAAMTEVKPAEVGQRAQDTASAQMTTSGPLDQTSTSFGDLSTLQPIASSSENPEASKSLDVSSPTPTHLLSFNTPETTPSPLMVTSDEPGAPSDAPSSPNAEDPLASLFRVSECNIYGRLYKVGAAIEELSDVCKKCTCSSMGVDCQTRC